MIKTLKQTIKNLYYWIKKKLIQFKKRIILIIFGSAILAAPLLPPQIPDIALEKIQDKYEASDIKNEYRLEKTAFILDAIDENAIQAEVGNKNSDSFEPSLTLRKWDNETNFKVKYKHSEKEKDQKVDIENKKIKWKGEKTEVHYYDIKKGELLHDKVLEHDVFEVEVILLEKPDTNIVSFDIETARLSFYYQPELTQEEKDEGAERPENVIGSYAVYHESKQGDYSQMGLKNYRAGKAFHIYRPKIIDSAGTEVWGELNITDNLLTVEIPQEFLNNAVYPVRHAAGLTFGVDPESPGGSYTTWGSGRPIGRKATSPSDAESAEIDSITQYISGNSENLKGVMVASDKTIMSNGISVPSLMSTSADWYTVSYNTKPVISASAIYYIMHTTLDGSYQFYYDTLSNAGFWDLSNNYDNPTDPTDGTTLNYGYSIYCTYTAGEAEARRMFLTQ